jgi:restriction system protein
MGDKFAAWVILALVFVPGTIAWKLSDGNPAVTFWAVAGTFLAFCAWGVWYGRIDNKRTAIVAAQQETALRSVGFDQIDTMSGIEFEKYVAAILRGRGYQTSLTKAAGDFGVDIIAVKGGIRTAVQCKRQGTAVGAAAVQQVVAGAAMHDCTSSMVVCNRTFTRAAQELAAKHRCQLVDRAALQAMALNTAR